MGGAVAHLPPPPLATPLKHADYFYAVRISILLAILCEIFIQIDYFL